MGVDAVSAAPLPRVAARRRPVVTVIQGGTLSGEHRRRHTDAALDAARIVDALGTRAPVPPPAVDRDGLRLDVLVLGVSGPAAPEGPTRVRPTARTSTSFGTPSASISLGGARAPRGERREEARALTILGQKWTRA